MDRLTLADVAELLGVSAVEAWRLVRGGVVVVRVEGDGGPHGAP